MTFHLSLSESAGSCSLDGLVRPLLACDSIFRMSVVMPNYDNRIPPGTLRNRK